MKTKHLTLFLFIGITSLLIYGCGIRWNNVRLKDNTICTNYSNEEISTLPVPLIHDMVNGYKNNQLQKIKNGIIKNGDSLIDAHSIWFDLETLKKFIYHIENETIKKDNSKSSKNLGIRIYYTVYPDEVDWPLAEYDNEFDNFLNHTEKKRYGKYHTLVMIPTRKKGNLNIDFNPLDFNTYAQGLKSPMHLLRYSRNPPEPLINGSPNRTLAVGGTETSAQNHGSLIPPRDPNLNEEGF